MRFWRDYRLAEDLRSGSVTEKQQMLYLLVMTVFVSLFLSTTVLGTLYSDIPTMGFYDYLIDINYIFLTGLIVVVMFRINNKGDGQNFISRYTCLSFPIMVKSVILSIIAGFIAAFVDFYLQSGSGFMDALSETSPLEQKLAAGLITQEEYDTIYNDMFKVGLATAIANLLVMFFMAWRYFICFKIAAGVK